MSESASFSFSRESRSEETKQQTKPLFDMDLLAAVNEKDTSRGSLKDFNDRDEKGAKGREERLKFLEGETKPQAEDNFQRWLRESETFRKVFSEDKKNCPWGEKIQIDFVAGKEVAGYDPATSRLIIGLPTPESVKAKLGPTATQAEIDREMRRSSERMVEQTTHQLYAATHQSLSKLYDRDKPMSKDDYVALQLANKAAGYLTEIKVNRELRHTEPVKFGKDNLNDLLAFKDQAKRNIDEEKSVQALSKFLEPRVKRHYETNYDNYVKYFQQNKDAMARQGYLKPGW